MNLEYAAGIFDGEGYVYIFKKQRQNYLGYYVSVGLTMCHYPTVKAFHDQFGGHLNSGSARVNPKHRNQFMWGLSNQMAAKFLVTMIPHLVIKKDEAIIAVALQAHIELYKKGPYDRDKVLIWREGLFQQCKALKSVEFAPLLRKGPGPSGRLRGRPPNP